MRRFHPPLWTLLTAVLALVLQGCGIGGYHVAIYKTHYLYSGTFSNREGLSLAYRARTPSDSATGKRPLLVYIDGSGHNRLDGTRDGLLAHFQARGFVAAAKQKRGIKPSQGKFKTLDQRQRIADNLDFIQFLVEGDFGVDPDRVYVMGHSEGAVIAASVAHQYAGTAGLIWASAGFSEDFMQEILKQHRPHATKLIQELKDGTYPRKTWQGHASAWWYQHFNHQNIPEIVGAKYPILMAMGLHDPEYATFMSRYQDVSAAGHASTSLYVDHAAGHGIIAGEHQPALLVAIDEWLRSTQK